MSMCILPPLRNTDVLLGSHQVCRLTLIQDYKQERKKIYKVAYRLFMEKETNQERIYVDVLKRKSQYI